jgi:phosphatidylglycerophosphate synthase
MAAPAPGRPLEIEEWSNRRLVHPLSRLLVDRLEPTPVTPNQVSVMGAVMAACSGLAYWLGAWPAGAFAGLAFGLAWHVFDGADGQLARRTGRASPNGELVDGICDHAGQLALYLCLALALSRQVGAWAFALALGAGLSRAAQANAYETCRRNYRRWVYGAGWIRQTLGAVDSKAGAGLARLYLAVSETVSADDRALEAAMAEATSGPKADAARALYRAEMQPVVKRAGLLSANWRTLAVFLSLLGGSPLWYLLWELVVLNLALVALPMAERRAGRRVIEGLTHL